jgi:hypothetical protein
VTTQWESLKITDPLVPDEHQQPAQRDCSDYSSKEDGGNTAIQIGDDFLYDRVQLKSQDFVGDSNVKVC